MLHLRLVTLFARCLSVLVSLALLRSAPLSAAPGSSAAARNTSALAQVAFGAGRVEWLPSASLLQGEGLSLVVSDPAGRVQTLRFAPAVPPVFFLIDSEGLPLSDGTYTWELRALPTAARLATPDSRSEIQSGSFTIQDGRLIPSDLREAPEARPNTGKTPLAAKDQTVPDDLIVDGKGCIGLGCATNEAFGQEALRLKQSVVRLKFEDTSAQPGFPTRDWQISVNDGASGGADRFSIEDLTAGTMPVTIQGGAPNSSVVVDSQGRLGLGTAVPAQTFHLLTSGTPALRLERTGGSPRVWDLAADATSFRLVDVTNSSAVPFRIAAGAPADTFVAAANGTIGMGTTPGTTPAYRLQLVGGVPGDAVVLIRNSDPTGYSGISFDNHIVESPNNAVAFFFGVDNANSITRLNSIQNFPMVLYTNGAERLRIQPGLPAGNGYIGFGGQTAPTHPLHHLNGAHLTTGGVWTNASSRKFKQDIRELDSQAAMTALEGLTPVEFAYKADPSEHHVGFIAEDVPELVAEKDRTGLSPMDIVAVLTKVVQEQQAEIQAGRAQIEQLATRLAELEGRLGQVKK